MYCKKPAPVGYLYVTVDLPNYSGGHFFHYRYFVIHIVKVSGQSDWIRIHNAGYRQCCGSGSARTRTFWSDLNPIKLYGSGSGERRRKYGMFGTTLPLKKPKTCNS